MPKIFISYRRLDSAYVSGRIYDRLEDHFGKDDILKDIDSIPYGIDFRQEIERQIQNCNILVAIIGPNWLRKPDSRAFWGRSKRYLDNNIDFVNAELEIAIKHKIPILPVLVDNATMPSPRQLPAHLSSISYINALMVRPDPDFRRDMERLITSIEIALKPKSQIFMDQMDSKIPIESNISPIITISEEPQSHSSLIVQTPKEEAIIHKTAIKVTSEALANRILRNKVILSIVSVLIAIVIIASVILIKHLNQYKIEEFSLHGPTATPSQIISGVDGNLWFIDNGTIGRMTTSGVSREFLLPEGCNGINYLASGIDNKIWFTCSNAVGYISTDSYAFQILPMSSTSISAITVDVSGNAWFTELGLIGKVTNSQNLDTPNLVTTYPNNVNNDLIIKTNDNKIWFTSRSSVITNSSLNGISSSGIFFASVELPETPVSLEVDNSNNIWFLTDRGDLYSVSSDKNIHPHPISDDISDANGLSINSNGDIWFVSQQHNSIGRIDSNGGTFQFTIPTLNCKPFDTALGSDGNIWFTESSSGKIGRIFT